MQSADLPEPRRRLEAAKFIQTIILALWMIDLTLLAVSETSGDRVLFFVISALMAAVTFWLLIYQRKMIRLIKAEP